MNKEEILKMKISGALLFPVGLSLLAGILFMIFAPNLSEEDFGLSPTTIGKIIWIASHVIILYFSYIAYTQAKPRYASIALGILAILSIICIIIGVYFWFKLLGMANSSYNSFEEKMMIDGFSKNITQEVFGLCVILYQSVKSINELEST